MCRCAHGGTQEMPRWGQWEGKLCLMWSSVKSRELIWCQGGLGAKSGGGTDALVMPTELKCLLRVCYMPEFVQGAKRTQRRKMKTRHRSKHWHFSPVRWHGRSTHANQGAEREPFARLHLIEDGYLSLVFRYLFLFLCMCLYATDV